MACAIVDFCSTLVIWSNMPHTAKRLLRTRRSLFLDLRMSPNTLLSKPLILAPYLSPFSDSKCTFIPTSYTGISSDDMINIINLKKGSLIRVILSWAVRHVPGASILPASLTSQRVSLKRQCRHRNVMQKRKQLIELMRLQMDNFKYIEGERL